MSLPPQPPLKAIIIGAGFSGLTMACKLKRSLGIDDYCIYDRNDGIGGAWWTNTYPGCGVDIPAVCYSLSFAPNPGFTQVFPRQAEILNYIVKVASDYGVDKHVVGRTEWKGATWQEHTCTWLVALEDLTTGRSFVRECCILISAVGGFVNPNGSSLPSMHTFQGHVMHTANWDWGVELQNKNVAVIGNGASATQLIPAIAGKPRRLTQFMRTPHHIVPSTNYGISLQLKLAFQFIPGLLFLIRILTFLYMEATFFHFRTTKVGRQRRAQSRRLSTEYMQSKAPGKYWNLLTPMYEFGCKRRVFDQGYVDTLNRHDVRLTDERIVQVKEHSLVTSSGEEVRADIIILATGFSLTQYNVNVQGRHGKTRDQHWQEYGCKATFKSVAMHDFPNFFYVLGPNSARLHTSALLSIESFVDLIAAVIKPVLEQRASCVQVKHASEQAYTEALHSALGETVHDGSCSSYLIDKQSGKNWFVYPWNTLQLWLMTHWRVLRDWEYEPAGL